MCRLRHDCLLVQICQTFDSFALDNPARQRTPDEAPDKKFILTHLLSKCCEIQQLCRRAGKLLVASCMLVDKSVEKFQVCFLRGSQTASRSMTRRETLLKTFWGIWLDVQSFNSPREISTIEIDTKLRRCSRLCSLRQSFSFIPHVMVTWQGGGEG